MVIWANWTDHLSNIWLLACYFNLFAIIEPDSMECIPLSIIFDVAKIITVSISGVTPLSFPGQYVNNPLLI